MGYLQAGIPVAEHWADALSDALMAQGALSVAIEDAGAGTDAEQPIFGEPGMARRVWRHCVLNALFAEDADVAAAVAAACAETGCEAGGAVRVETLADQDWVRLTQSQFAPIRICERLWITPTWHDAPAGDGTVHLRLDPGVAFGTGSHPTTQLCLRWLDARVRGGETVLDYGCGSGILAIAALKFGASAATGVDIDPQAVEAARANAAQNHVCADFCDGGSLPDHARYDIVVANILANTLRVLAHVLAARTRTGGRVVLSGILAEQTEELNALYARWFDMDEPVYEQGWVCLSGTKRA
ncbi:50S ribosomal protein L11 methyltransferase [Conchiformibius kuhniae]|uniref:Ribosomal protein L11 methyltransferase n=1 Tax=Conchiformibius kuhniae TaxID=211502 RepID=A0A8T9MVM2_9NEIS|nr:50S ribosomal protein L11 methyltransferase [Conchiformibius kuhniae]UOP04905.1 50S ribosomal protein L11 methyltransferase [Conchiformibius kuhniae]